MVYTSERAVTAAVSCGTSHVSGESKPLYGYFKKQKQKKIVINVL